MKYKLKGAMMILMLMLLFFSTSIKASPTLLNGKISGIITDKKTGQPIPGATVAIPDLKTGTSAGVNGSYTLKNLPRGKYLVEVSAIGYASVITEIDLGKTETADFKLTVSSYELADVVVTALGNTTTRQLTPVPVTVITHKMILEGKSNTAIDEIASQLGINETTEGPGTTKPQINGLGFDRILTLMDGVPQEDFQWGDDHGILIDPYAVYNAEVIRGPASLQYGASAEAGVISFNSEPLPENGTVKGSLLTEYHTNNGFIGTSANIAGNNNGFVWDLRGSAEVAHDYSDPKDGYVWGSAWNQYNTRLRLSLNRSWGYSRLTLSALRRRIQVPDGNRDSTGRFEFDTPIDGKIYPTHSDFTSYSAKIAGDKILDEYQAWWQNSVNVGSGRIGLDIGFTESVHHDIDTGYVGSNNMIVNDIPYSLKYQVEGANSGIKLTTGINGIYEFEHNLAEPPAPYVGDFEIPNYHNFEIGGYVVLEKNFKNLTLSGGLRIDRMHFTGQPLSLINTGSPDQAVVPQGTPGSDVQFVGFNNTYTGPSGSIGATYQLPDNNYLKLNISKSYRAPAINELTSNGLNIGSNAFQLGNINLKAEEGYQLDLAYGYNGKDVSFEADGFYNRISNFIFADRTDSVSQGYPVYEYVSSNVAIITGISAYLNIHPADAKWLEFNNGFSYTYSHLPNATDSTQHVPWTPAPRLITELKFRLNGHPNSILSQTYLRFGMQHDWAQNSIYSALGTEIPSAAYTLFNAGIGTSFVNPKTGKTICSLFVNCTNLFNVGYADHLNLAQYFLSYNGNLVPITRQSQGIYNMGRDVGFKLVFPFGSDR
jgi:iron complex outermembrane recepter protein